MYDIAIKPDIVSIVSEVMTADKIAGQSVEARYRFLWCEAPPRKSRRR